MHKSKRMGLAVVAAVAAIAGAFRLHATWVQSPHFISRGTSSLSITTSSQMSVDGKIPQISSSIEPRENGVSDYRQLVTSLLPLANSGSAPAQYELASALHYCDEQWRAHYFSRTTGAARTPDEMRQLLMKLSDNTQKQLEEANLRCHSFAGDLPLLTTWNDWLNQAATVSYPPATFMKADLMLRTHIVDGDAVALQQAREMAIAASTSSDPAILFGMADFVDGNNRPHEQTGQLISAWWLLGCESGYDCSSDSNVIRGICTVDPQCADKPTVIEEIQRTNGANFGVVQQLAEQIRTAVNSHDPEAIRKYL